MALADMMRQKRGSGPTRPKNLRQAEGDESCGTCVHFAPGKNGAGRCMAYGGYPVNEGQLSDTFKRRRSG